MTGSLPAAGSFASPFNGPVDPVSSRGTSRPPPPPGALAQRSTLVQADEEKAR